MFENCFNTLDTTVETGAKKEARHFVITGDIHAMVARFFGSGVGLIFRWHPAMKS